MKEQIQFFKDIISGTAKIHYWKYTLSGELLDTTCPNQESELLHPLFLSCKFLERIDEFLTKGNEPYAVGTYMGLSWFMIFDIDSFEQEQFFIHMIGPVFTHPIEETILENFFRDYENRGMSFHSRHVLIRELKKLPVIFQKQFGEYALMLDYCVNNRRLQQKDLHYLVDQGVDEMFSSSPENYRELHRTMTELMGHLKHGETDVKLRKNNIMDYVLLPTNAAGVHAPLRSLKDAAVIFAACCANSAIDAGMSPVAAYQKADRYIGSIEANLSEVELHSIIGSMYEDYLHAMHEVLNKNEHLSEKVMTCKEIIDCNPAAIPSVKQLADIVGYTTYYLSRKFKAETGESLPGYINRRKIEYSKILLISTEKSIGEIAEELDFSSGSHFAAVFRKMTGMNPEEFRQSRANTGK